MHFSKFIAAAACIVFNDVVFQGTLASDYRVGSKVSLVTPVKISGGIVIAKEASCIVPDIVVLLKNANYRPKVYTDLTITKIGYTTEVISYLGVGGFRPFPKTKVQCRGCTNYSKIISTTYNLPSFGICKSEWCRYKSTKCYYNIYRKCWYRCAPRMKNKPNKKGGRYVNAQGSNFQSIAPSAPNSKESSDSRSFGDSAAEDETQKNNEETDNDLTDPKGHDSVDDFDNNSDNTELGDGEDAGGFEDNDEAGGFEDSDEAGDGE